MAFVESVLKTLRVPRVKIFDRVSGISQVTWVAGGAASARLLSVAVFMLVARIIGNDEFGKYYLVFLTTAVFGVFSQAGLNNAINKLVAEKSQSGEDGAAKIVAASLLTSLFFGVVVAVSLFSLSGAIASMWFKDESITVPLKISAFLLFFQTLLSGQAAVLSGLARFKEVAVSAFASGVTAFPAILLLAKSNGLSGVFIGLTFQAIFQILVQWVMVGRLFREGKIKITWISLTDEIITLFRYWLPSVISGLLITPVGWLATSILANVPGGLSEIAIYGVANQWRQAILFIPTAVGALIITKLAGANGSGDIHRFTRIFRLSLLSCFGVALLVFLTVFLLSSLILKGYGDGFSQGSAVLIIMCFSSVIVSINNMYSRAMITLGKMGQFLRFDIVWSAVFFICALTLVEDYRAVGLSLAFLMAAVFQLLYQIVAWVRLRNGGVIYEN